MIKQTSAFTFIDIYSLLKMTYFAKVKNWAGTINKNTNIDFADLIHWANKYRQTYSNNLCLTLCMQAAQHILLVCLSASLKSKPLTKSIFALYGQITFAHCSPISI